MDVGRAWRILESNRYMTIASTDGHRAWAAPVAYALDGINLVWASRWDARHSRHLADHPEVGIAIFDSTADHADVDGLQMQAVAAVVERSETEEALCGFVERYPMYRDLPVGQFIGPGPFRLYRADPREVHVLAPPSEHGDMRRPVALNDLAARAASRER